jgi:hypothetical protein
MRSAGRNVFVMSRSHWVATSKSSQMRRFSLSRPPSASTWANVCIFFSYICWTHARALHPHRHQLAGARGPPHAVRLLLKTQHRAVMASQTRGYLLAERVVRCLVDEPDPALGFRCSRDTHFLFCLAMTRRYPRRY